MVGGDRLTASRLARRAPAADRLVVAGVAGAVTLVAWVCALRLVGER